MTHQHQSEFRLAKIETEQLIEIQCNNVNISSMRRHPNCKMALWRVMQGLFHSPYKPSGHSLYGIFKCSLIGHFGTWINYLTWLKAHPKLHWMLSGSTMTVKIRPLALTFDWLQQWTFPTDKCSPVPKSTNYWAKKAKLFRQERLKTLQNAQKWSSRIFKNFLHAQRWSELKNYKSCLNWGVNPP